MWIVCFFRLSGGSEQPTLYWVQPPRAAPEPGGSPASQWWRHGTPDQIPVRPNNIKASETRLDFSPKCLKDISLVTMLCNLEENYKKNSCKFKPK